jgi:hypothetical protein
MTKTRALHVLLSTAILLCSVRCIVPPDELVDEATCENWCDTGVWK